MRTRSLINLSTSWPDLLFILIIRIKKIKFSYYGYIDNVALMYAVCIYGYHTVIMCLRPWIACIMYEWSCDLERSVTYLVCWEIVGPHSRVSPDGKSCCTTWGINEIWDETTHYTNKRVQVEWTSTGCMFIAGTLIIGNVGYSMLKIIQLLTTGYMS